MSNPVGIITSLEEKGKDQISAHQTRNRNPDPRSLLCFQWKEAASVMVIVIAVQVVIVIAVQVIVVIAVHPVHSRPSRRMIHPLQVHPFPTSSLPHPGCLFPLPDFSVQHLMPSSLCPLIIEIDRMHRASDLPAINSRSSTDSSHIMIVKTLIVMAHSPMKKGNAFSSVA